MTPTPRHATPADAPRIAIAGDVYTILLTGEHTAGAMMMAEHVSFPGGGPPPHTHAREDETFYIIEGTLTFMAAGRTFTAGPGESVHIPRGVVHTFRNDSGARARMLVVCRPAGIERMFLEIGTPWSGEPTQPPPPPTEADIQKILTICPRYGVEIQAPPA